MKLKVIGSNSQGNAYILENDHEALLIECGVRFSVIKQSLGFNLAKVVGCLVTHEHKDHCTAVVDVLRAGINVYSSPGTISAFGIKSHRLKAIELQKQFKVGGFTIKAFDVKHDCAEPVGYIIHHNETGRVLFLTDTYYCPYTFEGLHNVIVEANYCQQILDQRMAAGTAPEFLRNRVIQSHMSLATCKEFLLANDLRTVNNIVLIHLSDGNSDANRFQTEVRDLTARTVHVASKGMCINFNKTPF